MHEARARDMAMPYIDHCLHFGSGIASADMPIDRYFGTSIVSSTDTNEFTENMQKIQVSDKGTQMSITVEAIDAEGILTPLSPLPELPEHTKVRITVETIADTEPSSIINEQRRNRRSQYRDWDFPG
jgi:hypothetical protein